ncbi:hypothetical protein JTE90_016801 [Oedothorax gibbosus]|uniref:Uncharacterized protein n=1 Tax=Oedothorax gibbosus TaxID=931172 RepID=A0AAV6W0K9_9ARAC|nr:hypothetical protein JTE90_016801 [Oedothorax gibbosus]
MSHKNATISITNVDSSIMIVVETPRGQTEAIQKGKEHESLWHRIFQINMFCHSLSLPATYLKLKHDQ